MRRERGVPHRGGEIARQAAAACLVAACLCGCGSGPEHTSAASSHTTVSGDDSLDSPESLREKGFWGSPSDGVTPEQRALADALLRRKDNPLWKKKRGGQITVTGAVRKPGGLTFDEPLRITDLLWEVGWLTPTSNGVVHVLRWPRRSWHGNAPQGQVIARIDLKRLFAQGGSDLNVVLKDGDLVVFPTGRLPKRLRTPIGGPPAK